MGSFTAHIPEESDAKVSPEVSDDDGQSKHGVLHPVAGKTSGQAPESEGSSLTNPEERDEDRQSSKRVQRGAAAAPVSVHQVREKASRKVLEESDGR